MNNASHVSQDDLLLFALQFLKEEEALAVQQSVVESDDLRRQLGWIQGDLAAYAMTSDLVEVPSGSRERLMAKVGREKKFVTMPMITAASEPSAVVAPVTVGGKLLGMDEFAAKQRRTSSLAWAGWAVAAGLAVVAGLEYRQTNHVREDLFAASVRLSTSQEKADRADALMQTLTDAGAMHVSLSVPSTGVPPEPKPEAHASYLAKKGSLVFVASHLQPLDATKTYELWVLPADKSAPVPAGTFRPDAHGRASLVISELPKELAAGGFGVTVEPTGGSSSPTMPIVLAGA